MGTQIAALDTALLRVPTGTRWAGFGVTELEVVNVTLTDDDGATGTGFTLSVSGGAVAMRSLVEGLIGQATIGRELEGWERRWHGLWARTHRLGRGVAVPALSAVDIAVWDLPRPPRRAAPVPAAGPPPRPGPGLPQPGSHGRHEPPGAGRGRQRPRR